MKSHNIKKLKELHNKILPHILEQAKKSNIFMMLKDEDIVEYGYCLQIDDYGKLEIYSEYDGGMNPKLIERPCQYWLKKMTEERFYGNYIVPFKTYEEAKNIISSMCYPI